MLDLIYINNRLKFFNSIKFICNDFGVNTIICLFVFFNPSAIAIDEHVLPEPKP